VVSDYNGPQPAPPIAPIENLTITDCDLGSPTAKGPAGSAVPGPIYLYNARHITLQNVRIGGRTYNTVLSDVRDASA
jgi:polygalacturonase